WGTEGCVPSPPPGEGGEPGGCMTPRLAPLARGRGSNNSKETCIVPQEVYQHTFANGLTLLAEPMPHVRSAALNFLVPAGCVFDPPEHLGIASVLSDLITRGAGKRDSRQLTLALDNLGLDRDTSVGSLHLPFF